MGQSARQLKIRSKVFWGEFCYTDIERIYQMTKRKSEYISGKICPFAFPQPSHLKGMLMIYFYTTDNATQNQEAYNTFIESFIPLLASVPCPKCGMVGLLILYGTHPVVRQL